MKKITLKQIGYKIKGSAKVVDWCGDEGWINFKESIIKLDELNKENLLGCINDNGFGVQHFRGAEIHIYDLYEKGVEYFNRTIETKSKNHLSYACKGIKTN